MKFYVKKDTDLTKYNFVQVKNGIWFWYRPRKYGRGGVNIIVYDDDKRLTFNSASADSIALVCEMYKNDDVIIVDDNELTSMYLTEEEVDWVLERRNKNDIK